MIVNDFPLNRLTKSAFSLAVLLLVWCTNIYAQNGFIRTDPVTKRYFVDGAGTPWVPFEVNLLIFPTAKPNDTNELLDNYERLFSSFAANHGNAVRVWWGPGNQFEVEDDAPGRFNLKKLDNMDRFLALAKKYNIRLKLCMSLARTFTGSGPFSKPRLFAKNGGIFNSFADYLNTDKGVDAYMNRLKIYLNRYKNDPTIYCWEIWNEINAVSEGNWLKFSQQVTDSVKKYAPNQLCTVSMGSMDSESADADYLNYFKLKSNDTYLIHRYLDPGAPKAICHGPIDEFLNDAVNFAYSNTITNPKPVFVNEVGAVKAHHSGDSPLYKNDTLGLLAHDMIFTPFFSGAAGPGSLWHEWEYLDKFNLWYHYSRFYTAISGCNPIKQKYTPLTIKSGSVNAYILKGTTETIMWCKNSTDDVAAELENGIAPVKTTATYLPKDKLVKSGRSIKKILSYDPWLNKWTTLAINKSNVMIPAFSRTIVLKISY